MTKLLKSNLMRILKSKIFWIFIAFYAVLEIFLTFCFLPDPQYGVIYYTAEVMLSFNYGISFFPVQGLIVAMLSCLILTPDFHNGTIRNKIIMGYSKSKIYLASLLTSVFIALALSMTYLLLFFPITLPLYGGFTELAKDVIFLLLDGTLMMISYASIFTLIIMSCKNPTVAVIVCVVILAIGTVMAVYFDEILIQSKDYEEIIAGSIAPSNTSKPSHAFAQFWLDCFPSGQSLQLNSNDSRRWQMAIYPPFIVAITSGIGMLIFKRSEIK